MILRHAEPWEAEALCAQIDPELWFPPKTVSPGPAKRICNGFGGRPACPVRDLCLEKALLNDERFGVWGGLTDRERRKLRPKPL